MEVVYNGIRLGHETTKGHAVTPTDFVPLAADYQRSREPRPTLREKVVRKLLRVLSDKTIRGELIHRGYSEVTITTLRDGETVEHKAILEKGGLL